MVSPLLPPHVSCLSLLSDRDRNAKDKPLKKCWYKKHFGLKPRRLIWSPTSAKQPKHSGGGSVLPNSAISWGFTLPARGVCDWTLVNTETESRFTDSLSIPGGNREKEKLGQRKKTGTQLKAEEGRKWVKDRVCHHQKQGCGHCCWCQGAQKAR